MTLISYEGEKTMRKYVTFSLLVVMTCAFLSISMISPTFADQIDWIKPGIPDVNKPDLDPDTPGWQKDNSCAVASTTNMLWAAGYRYMPDYDSSSGWSWSIAGDPFDLYESILDTSNEAGFGSPSPDGWSYSTQVGWMDWYFQNNINETNNPYKIVKWKEDFNGLTQSDKEYLIKELERCQYVELGIGGSNWYHSVTMVGYFIDDGLTGTILHDSDRTDPNVFSNDYYNDIFVSDSKKWELSYSAEVFGYKTLCPIPEPTTMLLLGSGILGLAGFRRKFKRR
jgi:hypothetical protein